MLDGVLGEMSEGCLWRGSRGTRCSRGSERSARQQHSEGVVGGTLGNTSGDADPGDVLGEDV
jgi:hypothetical protein